MLNDAMAYLSYLTIGLSTLWCGWNFKRLRLDFRGIAIYVVLTAIVQGIGEGLATFNMNNLALSHVYTLFGFSILLWFYQKVMVPLIPANWFSVVGIGFAVLAVLNVFLWQPLTTFNSITLTVQAVILIIFSISTFILTLNEVLNEQIRPILPSLNWINSGIFIYFSGSLFLFYNGEVIIYVISKYWSENTWSIHAGLSIILHGCLFMGLWRSPKG